MKNGWKFLFSQFIIVGKAKKNFPVWKHHVLKSQMSSNFYKSFSKKLFISERINFREMRKKNFKFPRNHIKVKLFFFISLIFFSTLQKIIKYDVFVTFFFCVINIKWCSPQKTFILKIKKTQKKTENRKKYFFTSLHKNLKPRNDENHKTCSKTYDRHRHFCILGDEEDTEDKEKDFCL